MWDPVHQPGIEPVPLYWKRGVLTTGPPGKSQICALLRKKLTSFYDSDGKESAFSVGDPGSILGSRRYPGGGNGYPLQYSYLENSMDRGVWWAIVHGVAESQTELVTEHTHSIAINDILCAILFTCIDYTDEELCPAMHWSKWLCSILYLFLFPFLPSFSIFISLVRHTVPRRNGFWFVLLGTDMCLGFRTRMLAPWKKSYAKLSVLKSRYITFLTKLHIVKAMVFPVVMYGFESWTIKKAEHQRTDAFKLWYWRRLLESPFVHGDQISPP